MSERLGIVEYFGSGFAGSECGYCKKQKPPGVDSSLWAHYLSADNYQQMIDRGWRRSGKYCYKPDLKKSCCPPYTIKCDTLKFQLSKSQKAVLNTMYRFLAFGEVKKTRNNQLLHSTKENEPAIAHLPQNCDAVPDLKEYAIVKNGPQVRNVVEDAIATPMCVSMTPVKPLKGDSVKRSKAKILRFERGIQKIMDSKKCSREEALIVIRQRRDARIRKHQQKSLEERINRVLPENAVHKLEIRFASTMNEDVENFDVTHKLYERYQMSVHNDDVEDCSRKQFKRFLVTSPFEPEECELAKSGVKDGSLPTEYGSYHMQYWLDGELIAVGVIDVLTTCLSSVYFFYDPKYEFLSLGTYSALKEIHLTQQLQQYSSALCNYYMGFYIHSCVKMCYKRKYTPSYLLCPEAFTWHPIERCLSLLNENKYQRFELDLNTTDEASENILDDDILVLYKRNAMSYTVYKRMSRKNADSEVREYAKLVGKHCVKRMLLYRSD